MSDVPPSGSDPGPYRQPIPPPNVVPPPGEYSAPPSYAAYPRQGPMPIVVGDPNRLLALSDAYFGLSWVFVINFLSLIISSVITGFMAGEFGDVSRVDPQMGLVAVYFPFVITAIVIGFVSFRPSVKATYGMGWNSGTPYIASFLMAAQSWVCCGAIGCVIFQMLLSTEMKKYGVNSSPFGGVKKRDILAVVQQMRQQYQPPPGGPMQP